MDVYIYVLVCCYYNWTLFLWCPKVYKCNWAANEIYIQQPNIYKLLFEDVYIRRWLLAKYTKDVYMRLWVLTCKQTGYGESALTHILPMLHFCTPENARKPSVFWRFQEVQKCNIGRIWAKDVYKSPWLLEKIRSARKGLNCK